MCLDLEQEVWLECPRVDGLPVLIAALGIEEITYEEKGKGAQF